MRNQFFFTRVEGDKTFRDSFNMNKVIRSVQTDDNTLIVLLDDLHERVKEVPNISTKSNKVTGIRKQVEVFQSEIYLSGEDIERFYEQTKLVNI